MAFSAAAFAAAAVTTAGAILKFESENVLNDGPGAIAGPSQPGAVNSVAQAIARQTCRRYADGVDGLDEGTAVNLERVCRPYLENIGYGSGPELKIPFEGGQCEAGYEFTISSQGNPSGLANVNANRFTRGPIMGWRVEETGTRTIGYVTSNSVPVGSCTQIPAAQGIQERVWFDVAARDRPNGFQASVTTVCPGNPDNCGNPPPVIDPVEPPPTPGPDTEPYNPEPGIDIDITVNLRPDSLVEINLGLGPVVVPVFGGGDGSPGGGDDGGGPVVDPDTSPPAPEPGPENPGGNGGFGGDDEFGPPPAGRRWVGCCIRITNTPSNASSIPGSEPEDVYPSVIGNIRLVCNAAGNRLVDTPVRILAKNVCVWEPVQKLNPTGVNVDLLPGYGYTFRPFSVPSGD